MTSAGCIELQDHESEDKVYLEWHWKERRKEGILVGLSKLTRHWLQNADPTVPEFAQHVNRMLSLVSHTFQKVWKQNVMGINKGWLWLTGVTYTRSKGNSTLRIGNLKFFLETQVHVQLFDLLIWLYFRSNYMLKSKSILER